MIKRKYNKLVRDNIPAIIERDGRKAEYIIITNLDEKLTSLKNKLVEEVQEYNKNDEIEELADISEIILAILKIKNISQETFDKLRKEKKQEKGGFDKYYFLISVEEK